MNANIPVVVLCGGNGVLVDGGQKRVNKSLISIAGKPLVSHVVSLYLKHGFRTFHFALGKQGAHIKDAILGAMSDTHLNFKPEFHFHETGNDTATGDRLKKVTSTLNTDVAVCYSDTLSDVNLDEYFKFFKASKALATMVGAKLPTRFKILGLRPGETIVRAFADEPVITQEYVNGGYYFFHREALSEEYFPADTSVVLEDYTLSKLAKQGKLECFVHRGEWCPYDGERDLKALEAIALINGQSV